MYIIIDGYNLLKTVHGHHMQSESKKQQCIALLKRYSKKKEHTIILVLDGGVHGLASREQHATITVIYSGADRSADDVIIEYIERCKEYDWLVVTADREIIQAAHACRAETIGPHEFYQIITREQTAEAVLKKEALDEVVKLTDHINEELDALMEATEFNYHAHKQEVVEKDRTSVSRKPSKKERSKLKKVGKL